jgi:hypothetical protein
MKVDEPFSHDEGPAVFFQFTWTFVPVDGAKRAALSRISTCLSLVNSIIRARSKEAKTVIQPRRSNPNTKVASPNTAAQRTPEQSQQFYVYIRIKQHKQDLFISIPALTSDPHISAC